MNMMIPKERILIVNDSQDCGHPYSPLFGPLGDVTQDTSSFKLNTHNFKLMVFTGGSDVSPVLYDDTSPRGVCHTNPSRDAEEVKLFKLGLSKGIKMTGICRGMQFLNVMSGGKMIHDLTGHNSSHLVSTKDADEPFNVNSFHHQACIPAEDTEILAWSHEKQSLRYIGNGDLEINYTGPEVEAIYNMANKMLAVQWHPEAIMNSGDATKARRWYVQMLKDFLVVSPKSFTNLYLGMQGSKIQVMEHE